MKKLKSLFIPIFIITILSGCTATGCNNSTLECNDPLEGLNRKIFDFNINVLDAYVLKPVATAWKNYLPSVVRLGISNFITNLSEPSSMINTLLAGRFDQSFGHFMRFTMNTTLGIGGLIDVAGDVNPNFRIEPFEFGHLLGAYNIGYGPYFMLPGYGPATIRQTGGHYVDLAYLPLSAFGWIFKTTKWAIEGIEGRAKLLEHENLISDIQDPYNAAFQAYFQRTNFIANDGKVEIQNTPSKEMQDIFDEIDNEG